MTGQTTSWTETRVKGPATLSFKFLLCSDGGVFNVIVDGVSKYSCNDGSSPLFATWEEASVDIPSGVHTVRLAYTHSGSGYLLGGNGVWVDQLRFEGGTPAGDDDGRDVTTTTEVPVPYSWLAAYYPSASPSDYETIASQKGANGCYVWESYVAGLDPTDEKSVFKALIAIKDGKPVVTYDPVLTAEQTSLRKYTVYGKRDVSDDSWTEVSAGNESSFGFFMVTVEMR